MPEPKAETPPADPPKVEPQPTPEELQAQIQEFQSTFYGKEDLVTRQRKAKAKAKIDEAPVAEEPPAPEPVLPPVVPAVQAPEPVAEIPPEPAKKVVVPPPLTDPVDDEDTLTERIAERIRKKQDEKVNITFPTQSEREKKMLEALKEMETIDPVYKGIDQRYLNQKKKEDEYIAKWEQDNGRTFNDQDPEHDDFYKTVTVVYDQEDFALALDSLHEKKATERSNKLIEQKLRERDLQANAQTERQAIHGVVNSAITDFIGRAVPEFDAIITVNGQRVLNKEVEDKMEELDPVALTILKEESEQMSAVVRELEEATRLGDAYKADPSKTIRLTNKGVRFAPFAEMIDVVNNLESEMLKLPPEQTARDGKRLLSVQDYSDYQKKIANNPKLQSQFNRDYYCLGPDDFRAGIVAQSVSTAKSRIERHKKLSTKKAEPTPQVVPKVEEPTPTPPAPPLRRNGSTVVPSSDTVNTRKQVNDDDIDPVKLLQAVRVSR